MKKVLGAELERLRLQSAVTQEQAAQRLRCGQSKIAQAEGGSGIKAATELDALLELYGADENDAAYARALQAESNRRTKRGAFSTRFKHHMRLLVDMEPSCNRMLSHRSMVVPGLLQTEAYMRAQFRAWRPSPTQDEIDRDTANRLGRQRVLDNAGQTFWFIIDEAALRRTPISPKEMKPQIIRLVEVIDRPNVELQIVPFEVGYYMGQEHDYTVFEYDTRTPVSIVYLETHDGGEYVGGNKISRYLELFDQQKAAAIGQERARRFLLDFVADL
ncbi:helix-turn-helix domain-containing protein [Amycolatopsis aidingensis]|uniref:helix-turn-helix domain-containing protein n=1 Tax=Amycolatopsis aidingensis TaxID=2842453 RepID=UPI001E35ACBD|nr:helix-turn-helix transcriptional regulator [Amycolatopsis aidingensis]